MVLFDDVGHAEASVLKDTYTILPKVFSHLDSHMNLSDIPFLIHRV